MFKSIKHTVESRESPCCAMETDSTDIKAQAIMKSLYNNLDLQHELFIREPALPKLKSELIKSGNCISSDICGESLSKNSLLQNFNTQDVKPNSENVLNPDSSKNKDNKQINVTHCALNSKARQEVTKKPSKDKILAISSVNAETPLLNKANNNSSSTLTCRKKELILSPKASAKPEVTASNCPHIDLNPNASKSNKNTDKQASIQYLSCLHNPALSNDKDIKSGPHRLLAGNDKRINLTNRTKYQGSHPYASLKTN